MRRHGFCKSVMWEPGSGPSKVMIVLGVADIVNCC